MEKYKKNKNNIVLGTYTNTNNKSWSENSILHISKSIIHRCFHEGGVTHTHWYGSCVVPSS